MYIIFFKKNKYKKNNLKNILNQLFYIYMVKIKLNYT